MHSNNNIYFYLPPSQVFHQTPVLLRVEPRWSVTTGTHFTGLSGTSAVRFGSQDATSYTVGGGTQITAIAPAASEGPVDITVTGTYGTSATSSSDQFTYVAPIDQDPILLELSTNSGPVGTNPVTFTVIGGSGELEQKVLPFRII
jgi:hypothetical protein